MNSYPDLPIFVTNNAVVATSNGALVSLMGLGPPKTASAITNRCFVFQPNDSKWVELAPGLPEPGRIAATAQLIGNRIFLFGGYEVSDTGHEHTSPSVNIYSLIDNTWDRGRDIPIPVDDSVSIVFRDRFIYLISGWSELNNVSNVQIYDTETDQWRQGTEIIGAPLFGHFGAVIGNTIFYFDGVKVNDHKYMMSSECWSGTIDDNDYTNIRWSPVPQHPGAPRYRSAAAANTKNSGIIIVGGTDNPYNYNGIGYNSIPATPLNSVLSYDAVSHTWSEVAAYCHMDHRGLLRVDHSFLSVGGMDEFQNVTKSILTFTI